MNSSLCHANRLTMKCHRGRGQNGGALKKCLRGPAWLPVGRYPLDGSRAQKSTLSLKNIISWVFSISLSKGFPNTNKIYRNIIAQYPRPE
jgi:hypothetical protein